MKWNERFSVFERALVAYTTIALGSMDMDLRW